MNTQQQMLRILQATNAYYESPTANGWEPAIASDAIFATHRDTGRVLVFTLNPDTKVIKAESYSFKKPGSITLYTGTLTLGGRLIAPDMILALHTLFNFDFASDATYVVEKNRAKKMTKEKTKKKSNAASDATNTATKTNVPEVVQTLSLWNSSVRQVRTQSKFSKFARRIVYPEFRFWRKS